MDATVTIYWQRFITEAIANPLSVAAGVLLIASLIPYVRAIWRDRHKPDGTKPIKISWTIWVGLDYLVFAGMYAEGAANCQMIAAVIGGTVVVVLAWRYGLPGWRPIDKLCIIGAAFGMALRVVFDNSVLLIMVGLAMMFIGAIPTLASVWEDPTRENRLAWTIMCISSVCAVIAIPEWTWQHAAQPLVFLAIQSAVAAVLFVRPRMLVARRCD